MITSTQLRTANIIFLEHKKFSEQIPLLQSQISELHNLNSSWKRTDSLRVSQLAFKEQLIDRQNQSIDHLNNTIRKRNNVITYGTITSVLLIAICLFMK